MHQSGIETAKQATEQLSKKLMGNLASVCLYGSHAREQGANGAKDINLLIILNESTPQAHEAMRDVLRQYPTIAPLIMERTGLERAMSVFAPKFNSISRSHVLLLGDDLVKVVRQNEVMLRALCEQQLRNLRMRTTVAFVRTGPQFARFLQTNGSRFVQALSDVARLDGQNLPQLPSGRIGLLTEFFGVDASVLSDLLEARRGTKKPDPDEIYSPLTALLTAAVRWVEENWETP